MPQYAIRDQTGTGTNNENIREKAVAKDWNLTDLRTKVMKCESVASGEDIISERNTSIRLPAMHIII